MVKYAGQEPTSEQIAMSIDRAREFITMRAQPAIDPAQDVNRRDANRQDEDASELVSVAEASSTGATDS